MPQCPNCLRKGNVFKKIDAKFSVYFCRRCHNGFTHPVPKHIEKYYHSHFWASSGWLGYFKNIAFDIFQRRRIKWIAQNLREGLILDVGSGEGKFAKALPKTYQAVSIEPPGSTVKERSVIKRDFLKWKTKQKFEAICFWESLEHTPYPQKYLEKAHKLLKTKGKIFIEFPRFNCLESRLFAKNWFHLDLPRHLAHLTDKGIALLLKRSGFKNVKNKNVLSFDYAPWGLTASLLNAVDVDVTDYLKGSGNLLLFTLLTPMTFLSFILEVILLLINQSPINLAIAEKK